MIATTQRDRYNGNELPDSVTVLINGRFLCQPVTGTQRYAHELIRAIDNLLAESLERVRVKVLAPQSAVEPPHLRRLRVTRVGRFSGQMWEQLELPFYASEGILFTPCGGAPLLHRRNVITIHDAAVCAVPRGYSFAFRTWYQFLNGRLCRTARHVLTVSQFSKAELVKWYGADPERVTVSYLGSEHALRPQSEPDILRRNGLSPFKYALFVGSNNPNKNLSALVSSLPRLASLGIQIVVAGPTDERVFERSPNTLGVCRLGYVSDSELRALYENASCFAFPSFYEGFGLPPLEALALGCPVVVAASTALRELFSQIAFMCNPDDPADIADKIVKACAASPEDRQRYRTFAQHFSWNECATTTWRVLSRISGG